MTSETSERLCTHGKRLATHADVRAWESRPYCVAQGDCRCPVCSTVCWLRECWQHEHYPVRGEEGQP